MKVATANGVAVPEATDLDLVARHRYGDEQAFTEIYQRYATMVYNLSLRLSGSPDEALDLTQEIFLRIFRHLGKFRGRSSLKTWIYRVALNHCRSRLGRRRPAPLPLTGPGGETVWDIPDPGRSPEDRAVAESESRLVAAALARLPRRFGEAVALRDLEGLTYQEIAEVLHVRIGTVRSRIARGRERLRQILESGERGSGDSDPEETSL
jgi:RNA polymerase sigma-70 factor (ECF subfamily)